MTNHLHTILKKKGQKPRAICVQRQNKKASNFLEALCLLVENTGFEPVTSCLPGKRSSQLS